MPDLQFAASHSDMMIGLRDHILTKRCKYVRYAQNISNKVQDSELKNYNLSTTPGADFTKSVGPSPEFLQMPIAFNYR
jgi:general transcription factor 3C polypeptide 5 (transcription factor C subunit 1)